MQQSLGIFIESSQGNSGGFQQFIPGVRAGDTFDYARGEAARLYGGAADRFMETSQGRQSARDARMEDLGIHLGEQLEPAMEALAETAELLLPPLAEITGWFGKLASTLLGTVGAFGDIVEGFFKLGGVDFANVKRGLDLVGGNVEAGANLFPNLAPTQFQRATQLYRNADGTYGAANARGGLNGEVDYSSPFAVEQALKNLALSNPELGSRSMTSVVTPEQELRRRVQAYSPEGNIQQAYEYAVSAGAFAESGKFIGGTAGGVAGSAGGVTTGGGTGTGGLDTGELANNASAHISAMQQVDQEMSLSLSAMKGVQDVFSELSTFRVDFSQLKPNLDNLYDGITFLQQFWIDAAKSKETGITDRVYQQTQTWLEMVSAMVSLMTNASSMFADMTVNAAMMPTDDEMESLVNKSAKLFEMGDAIAKAVMKEGAAKGMEDLGDVKAWADRTQNVMQAISMAADAMVKVRNIRVPDAADIGRLGAGIRSIQTEIMTIAKDAVAANQAGGGIDISTAQTWVDKVSPLFQFAGMIADVFTKMRNLRIPTDDQIGAFEKAADNMLGGLVAIAKAFTGQREGGEPSPMDMYHETSGPSVDPFLAQAAETMGNAEKIMGFASTAASTFENMRRLRIPSDDSMDDLVGGAFDFLGKLTAAIPKGEDQQPVDLQLEAVYAAQGQAILGMAGAAVSVFQGMRRLRIPDQGAIDDMSQRSVKLVGSVASYVPKTAEGYTVDLSDQATYSEQGSKILGMVNTAVNLYQDMHRLRMPSPGMLDEVAKRAVDTVNSVASYLPADGDALHEAGLAAEDRY
jgi:hypothetical protein